MMERVLRVFIDLETLRVFQKMTIFVQSDSTSSTRNSFSDSRREYLIKQIGRDWYRSQIGRD
jgi:hypothetical protein